MILLEITSNWYWFLVFVGILLIITAIVLLIERKSEDEEILSYSPWIVLRNIGGIQISFYLLYLFIAFTVDIASLEVFWPQQVFTFVDFSFFSRRGILNGISLVLTFIVIPIPLASIVPSYKYMADYSFTVFVLHFIIVSIVGRDFPANGAWWTFIGLGFLFCWFLSERLSYQLSLMTYQSSLAGGPESKRKDSKNVELSDLDAEKKTRKVSVEHIGVVIDPERRKNEIHLDDGTLTISPGKRKSKKIDLASQSENTEQNGTESKKNFKTSSPSPMVAEKQHNVEARERSSSSDSSSSSSSSASALSSASSSSSRSSPNDQKVV